MTHDCRNKAGFLEFFIIVSGEFFPNKDVLGLVKLHCSNGRLISVRAKEGEMSIGCFPDRLWMVQDDRARCRNTGCLYGI